MNDASRTQLKASVLCRSNNSRPKSGYRSLETACNLYLRNL